jgi:hypothetical protein
MKMDLFLPINYKRIVPTVGSEKHCDSFARFNATAAAAAATTTDASASAPFTSAADQVRKRVFCAILMLKMIILPRQARGNHR